MFLGSDIANEIGLRLASSPNWQRNRDGTGTKISDSVDWMEEVLDTRELSCRLSGLMRSDAGSIQHVFSKYPKLAEKWMRDPAVYEQIEGLRYKVVADRIESGADVLARWTPQSMAFDIVETGRTARANRLNILDTEDVDALGIDALPSIPVSLRLFLIKQEVGSLVEQQLDIVKCNLERSLEL